MIIVFVLLSFVYGFLMARNIYKNSTLKATNNPVTTCSMGTIEVSEKDFVCSAGFYLRATLGDLT